MCEEAGVKLVFLPAYSPDFNPIEQSFSQLKMWMRKHRTLAEEWGANFEGFIQMALRCFMDNDDPRGHFRASFVGFPEDYPTDSDDSD